MSNDWTNKFEELPTELGSVIRFRGSGSTLQSVAVLLPGFLRDSGEVLHGWALAGDPLPVPEEEFGSAIDRGEIEFQILIVGGYDGPLTLAELDEQEESFTL